jgi:hypothetical protein
MAIALYGAALEGGTTKYFTEYILYLASSYWRDAYADLVFSSEISSNVNLNPYINTAATTMPIEIHKIGS